MKKLTLFLLFAMINCIAFAQQNTVHCDTIILLNDKLIQGRIDSISSVHVFYKKCSDTTSRSSLNIPLAYIKAIKTKHSKHALQADQIITANKEKAEAATEKRGWVFRKINSRITKKIKDGVKVKVHFISGGRKTKMKGMITAITDEHLYLKTRSITELQIEKSSITKISVPKQFGWLGRTLGASAAIAGIGLMLLVVTLVVGFFVLSFGQDTGKSAREEEGIPGCGTIALLFSFGIFLFLMLQDHKIKQPFNGDWEVSYELMEKKKKEKV